MFPWSMHSESILHARKTSRTYLGYKVPSVHYARIIFSIILSDLCMLLAIPTFEYLIPLRIDLSYPRTLLMIRYAHMK